MKTIKVVLARSAALVLTAGFVLGFNFVSHAQVRARFASVQKDSVVSLLAEEHGLKLADQWNRFGTYWYILEGRLLVPIPGAPNDPNLRIYSLGNDEMSFLVDDNTPPAKVINYARLEADLNWLLGALAQAEEAKLNAELNTMLGLTAEMDS